MRQSKFHCFVHKFHRNLCLCWMHLRIWSPFTHNQFFVRSFGCVSVASHGHKTIPWCMQTVARHIVRCQMMDTSISCYIAGAKARYECVCVWRDLCLICIRGCLTRRILSEEEGVKTESCGSVSEFGATGKWRGKERVQNITYNMIQVEAEDTVPSVFPLPFPIGLLRFISSHSSPPVRYDRMLCIYMQRRWCLTASSITVILRSIRINPMAFSIIRLSG